MTHAQRATWIRRCLIVIFWVVLAVWYFTPPNDGKKTAKHQKSVEQGKPEEDGRKEPKPGILHFKPAGEMSSDEILASLEEEAARRGKRIPCVIVVHFHTPGQPESEDIADSLNRIDVKYCKQVLVVRVDVTSPHGGRWAKLEKVTRTPDVLMTAAKQRSCRFQGVWPYPKIEKQVDLILFGLERVGKDWRPEVKGMQRAGTPAASP